jgi:hypothetical protein
VSLAASIIAVNNIPRFERGFLWDGGLLSRYIAPAASASEHADPLPSPPASILGHPDNVRCLVSDLFDVVTPINIDRFASLLAGHPNVGLLIPSLVGCEKALGLLLTTIPICTPLRGIFRNNRCPRRPRHPRCARWGGTPRAVLPTLLHGDGHLLPGMISVLVHTVPKKSGELRPIVNRSAGELSPNSHIACEDVHNDLDTVRHLG